MTNQITTYQNSQSYYINNQDSFSGSTIAWAKEGFSQDSLKRFYDNQFFKLDWPQGTMQVFQEQQYETTSSAYLGYWAESNSTTSSSSGSWIKVSS